MSVNEDSGIVGRVTADEKGRNVLTIEALRLPCGHGHLIQHDEWADGDFLVWEEMGMYEMKCGRVDCALEIVRPGKTQCRCDYDKTFPPGGPREPQMACPGGRVPTRQELIDMLDIDYEAAATESGLYAPTMEGFALAYAIRVVNAALRIVTNCHAGKDGDCEWRHCPQLQDGEPKPSGRDCPLWVDAALGDGT